MEFRFGFIPTCSLVDFNLTLSAPITYFIEHQKKKFLLRKNLRERRKDKGLISDKDTLKFLIPT